MHSNFLYAGAVNLVVGPFGWVVLGDRVRVRARRFWDSAVSATRLGDLSRRRRGGPPHRSIGLMALAGLWETWRSNPAGERVRSFAIVTTEPNELCAQLYNRMPAVLAPEAWPQWLGEEPADEAQLKSLLVPYSSEGMVCRPVSPRVGSAKNNDPSLIEQIAAG
jgi:SOS response associated peptidase (SRAP)